MSDPRKTILAAHKLALCLGAEFGVPLDRVNKIFFRVAKRDFGLRTLTPATLKRWRKQIEEETGRQQQLSTNG